MHRGENCGSKINGVSSSLVKLNELIAVSVSQGSDITTKQVCWSASYNYTGFRTWELLLWATKTADVQLERGGLDL